MIKEIKTLVKCTINSVTFNNHNIIDKNISYEIINLLDYDLETLDNIYLICLQMINNYIYIKNIMKEYWYNYFLIVISFGYIISWSYLIIKTII